MRRVEIPDDDALFSDGGGPQPVAAQDSAAGHAAHRVLGGVKRIIVGQVDRVAELRACGDVIEAQRFVDAEHH